MCKVKQANWVGRIWGQGGGEYLGLLDSDAHLNREQDAFVDLDRCQIGAM